MASKQQCIDRSALLLLLKFHVVIEPSPSQLLPCLLSTGDVRVNWRSGCKPSSEVKAGDVISAAGKVRA